VSDTMPKILVIDDDVYIRMVLRFRLEKEHWQVLTANDGPHGLEVAEQETPDLIVLDLAMPEIDGIQVLDRLQHNQVTWNIPVVVLTARSDPESRARSHRLGASRFLQKPFSPRNLVSEINRLLRPAEI